MAVVPGVAVMVVAVMVLVVVGETAAMVVVVVAVVNGFRSCQTFPIQDRKTGPVQ